MGEIEFTEEDFKSLEFIEKFNKQHWKAGSVAFGWNYDVEKTDPKILRIRDSLWKIKDKFAKIGEHFNNKDEYKDLTFTLQKITDRITGRYLSGLRLYYIKQYEIKAPNEPQLKIWINSKNIDISMWFGNFFANKKYLLGFINEYADVIKQDSQISLKVSEPGMGSKQLGSFSNKDWNKFIKQITELKLDCKVGFTFSIPKEVVLKHGENILTLIESHMDRMKLYFERACVFGERFLIAVIKWNDYGWKQPQIPESPSLDNAKDENMSHDSLNFKLDKLIDTPSRIYGYFQHRRESPIEFVESCQEQKIVFFYSKRKIVGIYGDAEFLEEKKEYKHEAFQGGKCYVNLTGKRGLSFGFAKEAYLTTILEYIIPKYFKKWRIGRGSFIYITSQNAKKIILDAIQKYEGILEEELKNLEAIDHLKKLRNILKTVSVDITSFEKNT